MGGSDYEDAARHFDRNHIPADRTTQTQIADYMESEFSRDTVPEGLIDEIAPMIAEDRTAEGGRAVEIAGGDVYLDPDSNAWRDRDTGAFTGGPPEG